MRKLRSTCGEVRRNQKSAKPVGVVRSITASALETLDGDGRLAVVGPAEEGDPTLLFLRSGGRTCMMIAVPPEVIRSRRLRGGRPWVRNHELEQEWELSRLLDFEDKHIDGIA